MVLQAPSNHGVQDNFNYPQDWGEWVEGQDILYIFFCKHLSPYPGDLGRGSET